jgi:hypothetical protein
MDYSLIYAGIGGLVIGGLLSGVLNVYSKSSANSVSRHIFGLNVMDLIYQTTFFAIGLAITILAGYSVLIRDLSYPNAHPIKFTVETLLMGFLCSSIIFIMTVFRGYIITDKTWLEFGLLFVKFSLLHILFQFSGIYSELFPYKKE